MSGLTAALSLFRRGHEVTVLECQERVGGRLLSLPLEGGQFSEAGAGHFRATMPYVSEYIRHFRLPILSLNDGLPRFLVQGRTADAGVLTPWPWDLHPDEQRVTLASTRYRYLLSQGLDAETVLHADWPDAAAIRRLDDVEVGDLIRRGGGSEAFVDLIDAFSGSFTHTAPALPALPSLSYHFSDQALYRIAGGNERLPRAMAEVLGSRVVHGAPVVALHQASDEVRVRVKDGREFRGHHVISTIPFTVLRDVAVTPAWSPRTRAMIDGMEWQETIKVVVQTRTPSWLAEGVHGWPMAGSDRPWERVVDITGNEPGGYGNAFFYLNGGNAAAYRAQPRATRGRELVESFRKDMPGLLDDVVTLKEFDWAEQPWIRASFGGPPKGGGWMYEHAKQPEGRIHFAGDFTTVKYGWVEGAIESGLRAARQIDPGARAEVEPDSPVSCLGRTLGA